MKSHVVLYRIDSIMTDHDDPFGFICFADDLDHAEEQCLNAYPDCSIEYVTEGTDYKTVLIEYGN